MFLSRDDCFIELSGKLVRGYQVASGNSADSPFPKGTIEMQAPIFFKHGLDLSGFFLATLNIDLLNTFRLENPIYHFDNIKWADNFNAETFNFYRCIIQYKLTSYKGYIYQVDNKNKIDHFHRDSVIEVIAEYIKDICYGDSLILQVSEVNLHLNKLS